MTTFTEFNRHFVGFDKLVDQLALASKLPQHYPPYNIRKLSDTSYVVELAIAGFGPSDIEVEIEDTKLVITGKNSSGTQVPDSTYVYKGISSKAFTREFTLAENVEITNAAMANGILTLGLQHKKAIKKSKKIEVTNVK